MIDNLTHNAFFSLLRSGLWNVSANREYFPLSDSQWLEIFQLARKQTVEAIVHDGIMALPVESFPAKDLIYKWTVAVDAIERQNSFMDQRICELVSFFSQKGLKVYLLKGQGVAYCYNQPNHRICGDIDFYFSNPQEYSLANALIEQQGIRIKKSPGFSSEYVWKGIQVEHHKKFIDIHNPFILNRLQGLLKSELDNSIKIKVAGQEVFTPSPLMTNLVVNTHILKHSLSFGIGLRQLCDSAKACYTYSQNIDGQRIEKLYKEIGMIRWMHVLNKVLVDSLGLDPKYLPFELANTDSADWMLNEILEAGNFGFADKRFGDNAFSQKKRTNAVKHLAHRFRLNLRYAPGEAISFPLMQVSSRIANCF
jgi:Uncharacterised nucleotidyltransferase